GNVEAKLERRDRTGSQEWVWKQPWALGWRDIARSTDERTMIAAIYPRVGAGDTLLQMYPSVPVQSIGLLLANLCAFVFDYATRQKISGTHLKFHVAK